MSVAVINVAVMSAAVIPYDRSMVRWEPDARGRLARAAMELYLENGFDQTTVAEIAKRAGLTERTFFRHFADKREVLFDGAIGLQNLLVARVADAPQGMAPIDVVVGAFEVAGAGFQEHRDFSRQRTTVITANAVLVERELIKLAALASAIAEALRGRGVTDPAASLAAEAGVAIFRIAFERWITDPGPADFVHIIRESLQALKAVTAGGS
jgi:AcrR family transcriptional regulator